MFSRYSFSWIILVLFLLLYLIFPSGSSTTDAWFYAASIKYSGEIFHPHHLLYNAFGYIFCYFPVKAGFDVLACLKVLNAVFAVMILIEVNSILRQLNIKENLVIIISCLSGLSFSIMRYATENETYIVPFFFALAGLNSFLKYTLTGSVKYSFYTAMWTTLSVLFHLIYFFWWIGLFMGFIIVKKRKPLLWYCVVSLSGPLVYLIVIQHITGNLEFNTILSFIFGNMKDSVHLELSGKGMFFSFVNLIRSFIQIHGYILNMIRNNILLILPGIISIIAGISTLLNFPEISMTRETSGFTKTVIIIILLQFIFAVLAVGNAEFMVMIPVMFFIIIPQFAKKNIEKFLIRIMIGLAVWNIAYGIVPLHYQSAKPEQFLCEEAQNKKDIMIIGQDDQLLKSMLYYQTGDFDIKNIFKSPALLRIKGNEISELQDTIDKSLNTGRFIFTDCLGPRSISRASIIEGNINMKFFKNYEVKEIKSWEYITGRKSVYKLEKKL